VLHPSRHLLGIARIAHDEVVTRGSAGIPEK
jgi:hypothetical protein